MEKLDTAYVTFDGADLEAFDAVLGETAWRMVSSDLSRRGFSGWFMEILVLNMEVLRLGIHPSLEPTS